MSDYRFNMDYDYCTDSIRVFIRKNEGEKRYRATIVFEEMEKGMFYEPTLTLPVESNLPDQMKQALKEMGRLHFADEATIKAKDEHLNDMRKLVFKGK